MRDCTLQILDFVILKSKYTNVKMNVDLLNNKQLRNIHYELNLFQCMKKLSQEGFAFINGFFEKETHIYGAEHSRSKFYPNLR